MIKCIVSDLDGTLFSEQHCLSEKTIATLHQAINAGYEFIIATGREWESVVPYFEPYGIKCYCILNNGAVLQDRNANVIQEIALDLETVKEVVKVMSEYDVNIELCTRDGNASPTPDRIRADFVKRMMEIEHITEAEATKLLNENHFVTFETTIDNWDEYLAGNPTIYKIGTYANDEIKTKKIRERLSHLTDVDISDSLGKNLELTHKNAQKGLVLADLIKTLGFDKTEVAVFGDGMNDYRMIKDFPNSYAPANAEDQIKAVAAHTIGYNHEDAVANEIMKIMENNQNL